jgi:Fic family protein
MRREEFTANAPGRLVTAPEGHLAFVPDPLPPNLDLGRTTINLLADAERALGELRGVGRTLPNPYLLINPLLRREAVLSSRIEGTTSGLQQLLLFEASKVDESERSDALEVANYVAALELGFSLLNSLPLSLRLIRQVHARLMESVRGQERRPGEFRRVPNMIGIPGATPATARFVPPPVKEMHEALNQFERYIGERPDDLPPLIRLAITHYQFEAIHPFMDGNGRVGRLLIPLQLQEWKILPQPLLYLSAYFEPHRDAYRDLLLDVSRTSAWTPWIDFFLQAVAEQAADTVERSHRLLALVGRYQRWALARNRSGNLAQLADLLFLKPLIAIADAEEWLGVTQPAASRLVGQMVDAGVLVEITGGQRNRRFLAHEIVAIIDERDGSEEGTGG